VLAIITLAIALTLWWKSRFFHMQKGMRLLFLALPVSVVGQIMLGIATLLTKVDLKIATVHQGGALVILAVIVLLWHHSVAKDYSVEREAV
jgi:cytochrome c oxidase assembly protein subunit 15